MRYVATVEKSGEWWIGWLPDLDGANAQERTLEELLQSLAAAATDLLSNQGIEHAKVEIEVQPEGAAGISIGV